MDWKERFKALFKNKRHIKTWLRCCVCLAVSLIFLVASDLDNLLGQAAFFAAILSMMLAPSFALSLFLLASTTVVVGLCLGWAWACAATAAAHSVRDQALLAQQKQAVQASLDPNQNTTMQLTLAIFQGSFLDPRVSAVFGAFLFIGTFFFATIIAFRPKLAGLAIFATIILDVQCSYAPVMPTPNYTLPKIILIPCGFYVAIALGTLIFIFPESLNHVWLSMLRDGVITPMRSIVAYQLESLDVDLSDKEAFGALIQRGLAARVALSAGFQGLQGQIALIDLEPTCGRLGANDLKAINKDLKALTIRATGLQTFHNAVNDRLFQSTPESKKTAGRAAARSKRLNEKETLHGHDLISLQPILRSAAMPLLEACNEGLATLDDWIRDCNSGRWYWLISRTSEQRIKQRRTDLEDCLTKLRETIDEFERVERVKLIKPFERFFDKETGKPLKGTMSANIEGSEFSVRSLFVCFVFVDTLSAFSESLRKILNLALKLDIDRPYPRVWMPIGLGSIGGLNSKLRGPVSVDKDMNPVAMGAPTNPFQFDSAATSEEDVADDETRREDGDDDEKLQDGVERRKRNPDAMAPRSALGQMLLKFLALIRFFRSPQGVFALRYGIVSVALWIPTVCTSSTYFVYNNRGLWALIMAQTGLSMFAGDQIFGFVSRIAGIIIGLLLGMVCWYVGAGSGIGNAYGIVVATTFFVSPFLWMLIKAPPVQKPFWTMIGVTGVFIVGYSWVDNHQAVLVNPGVGVELAWRRALLIMVGFTASFIVMIFPSPTSSRVFVRKSLAANLDHLSHILAEEVEAFLAEERRARGGFYEKPDMFIDGMESKASPKERRIRKFTPGILTLAIRLQELRPSLKTATWEPQARGRWPAETYEAMHTKEMLGAMVLLVGALARLDTRWCSIIVHHTPFMNPNFLADVFVHISILSSALADGRPLPPTFPSLRDRLVYHEQNVKHTMAPGEANDDSDQDSDTGKTATAEVDGSTIGFKELSLNTLMDPQLPPHSTAVIALSSIITLIDEITILVKDLCGETSFPSLDLLHNHFMTLEEEVARKHV